MAGSDFLISDIHFFGKICRGKTLLAAVRDIRKKEPRRVIIVGDGFHKPPRIKIDYFERKMRKHPKQAQALLELRAMAEEDGVEFVTVPGNHDPNLASVQPHHPRFIFGKVLDEYSWERDGVRYYATHGHQGDASLQHPLADFACSLHDLIQKIDQEDPKMSRKIEKMFTRKIREERSISTPRWVMTRAKELGARHAFWGHTHEPVDEMILDGVIGHGIGSFCEHPASYFEVTDRGPKLHTVG